MLVCSSGANRSSVRIKSAVAHNESVQEAMIRQKTLEEEDSTQVLFSVRVYQVSSNLISPGEPLAIGYFSGTQKGIGLHLYSTCTHTSYLRWGWMWYAPHLC